MAGPLDGIRVIDLTQMISGPMATMILADQGADVIKVEPPAIGDLTRAMGGRKRGMSPTFAVANRNKRSVVIDLKQPRGLAVLKQLVANADVVVQNFRPGAAERIGVGYDALREIRPDLIYVSISGFGEKGPYVHKRTYDPVIQALSGLMSIQADETGRPRMIRVIVPDKVTALTAAQAITAAIVARLRTGAGQHVRLAMLDAVVAFIWPESMPAYTFIGHESAAVRPPGTRDLVFQTADGYITAAANSDSEWAGLARTVGHPEWIEDPRFKHPADRIRNADVRLDLTAAIIRTPHLRRMAHGIRRGRSPLRADSDPRRSAHRSAGRRQRTDRGIGCIRTRARCVSRARPRASRPPPRTCGSSRPRSASIPTLSSKKRASPPAIALACAKTASSPDSTSI